MRTFRLTDSFIEQYKNKPVKWGFGAISHFTYKRTYSREKPDGSRERWWETVRRVVEGTYQAQLDHCVKNCLPFDMNKAQRSAQRMYQLIFEFKFLPPGRGLEHMGSDALKVKGGAILQNCGFVSTANIAKDLADPFCFLMDFSALGVGIGFDTRGAGTMTVKGDNKDKQQVMHVIQDSREGWVAAMRELLESYAYGKAPVAFDYSLIRPEGAPLKTLGGTASGPEPLRVCLERIRDTLEALRGKLITSVAITDIMNFIGCAIVAGGTRRSAEIALGDPNDLDFISMKDRTLYPTEMNEYRWASNNSVIVERGTKVDYDAICDSFAVAGEPGILWLDNAREYGRMGYSPDYGDPGAMGVNPCLSGDTMIATFDGPRRIDSLVGEECTILNAKGEWVEVDNFRVTARNAEVLRVETDLGKVIRVTPYHTMILSDGTRKPASSLECGDPLLDHYSGEARVTSVISDGIHDEVYCCTEPSDHSITLSNGIVVGQCGEQILWDHELCTLVEVLPSNHDDVDDVKETIKYAYLYAKSVTLVPTHDPRVNAVMQMNRRIGMSQTGIVAAMAKFGTDKYIDRLDEWYDYTQYLDTIYSNWLCVPRSRRTSTVKPSGTVSIVAGVTPGIHAPHSPYSIRRIRVQRTSPVWKAMADAGYEVEESVYGDNTMVVSFPVDESHIGIYKDDLLALEQLELAATMQAYWSDNGVSVTVTFKPVELPTIKRALPLYAKRLKAVSFLPYSDHGYAQAPYEAITKERYEEMVAKIKPVDFDEVYDRGESDKFCEGDKCLIG